MSEEHKAMAYEMIEEVWNKGRVELAEKYYTQDFVLHRPPFPDVEDLESYKDYVTNVRLAYPDLQITLHEVIAEGDTVATRWSWTGNHTGQGKLIPIPPTGKQVTVSGATLAHVEGGKIVEEWEHQDWLGFMQQLGLAPPPGGPG